MLAWLAVAAIFAAVDLLNKKTEKKLALAFVAVKVK